MLNNYSTPIEQGRLISVSQPAPTAGNEFVFTTNSQYVHEIVALQVTFVAAAVAVSRFFRLTLDIGGVILWQAVADAVATTGQTLIMTFAANVGATNYVNGVGFLTSVPSPSPFIGVHNLRSVTTNIQAADQYSAVILTERIWIP